MSQSLATDATCHLAARHTPCAAAASVLRTTAMQWGLGGVVGAGAEAGPSTGGVAAAPAASIHRVHAKPLACMPLRLRRWVA